MENSEIRQKIADAISKTEKSIEEFRKMSKPVAPDVAIGRISRMDAINNKSVAEAALRNAKEKLRNLRKVQSQLGTTEFGLCVKCKNQIPLGRILIRPQSLLCIKCAK